MAFFPSPTPVEAIEESLDGPVYCESCKNEIIDDAYYDGEKSYYCDACITTVVECITAEAKLFADENCKITSPLPVYDPNLEFSPTREEYEMGAREAYTRNSHRCHCRHQCTNYERLIQDFARDCFKDRIYYKVIKERIEELLQDEDRNDDERWEDHGE
jgi:hypothetical protein